MTASVATTAFIANTDFGWFAHFLHRADPPDEVNFWQPSPHGFKAIPAGAPFFFRLGAPHRAIAGYGFFARYERVPVWLAWESFRDLNGTDTFAEMTARIEAIRRRTHSSILARPSDYEVGCIMISQPVFFSHDDWISDHADWHPRIQGGKTVDILHGDGQRILAECLERTARLRSEAEPLIDDVRRYGTPRTVPVRLGQGTFRVAVTGAYGACAVTGEHSLPALEAAHVRPYSLGGEHALANGLLLRADIHRLYDTGYVTVTPDHRFEVSGDLFDDFHNGREYERYVGRSILLPRAAADRPDPELLEWHGAEVFRG